MGPPGYGWLHFLVSNPLHLCATLQLCQDWICLLCKVLADDLMAGWLFVFLHCLAVFGSVYRVTIMCRLLPTASVNNIS